MGGFRLGAMVASALIAMLATKAALAGAADGVWKTEANDAGGYLEVTIAPCASDAQKSCGTITSAYNKNGPDPKYANLGKLIIKDMSPEGGSKFSGGKIWDPQDNKTYDSHMTVKGDTLDVEGCVSIFCKGEDWTKVK